MNLFQFYKKHKAATIGMLLMPWLCYLLVGGWGDYDYFIAAWLMYPIVIIPLMIAHWYMITKIYNS